MHASDPPPSGRLKVLVVDDSALVRQAISDALSRDPQIEVVGTACDPYVAREKILRLDPDVITLDLEMPRMDGLTFLRILMKHHPLPVVVVSSLAQRGSRAALEALEAGAVDVLAKPNGTLSVGDLANRLAYHVKAAAASGGFLTARRKAKQADTPPAPLGPVPATGPGTDPRGLIVIGSSTGGVEALRQVLPRLPLGLPPIAVVQHISATFSAAVATRLDELSAIRVVEAADGMRLERDHCVIAPGDVHLAVHWQGDCHRVRLVHSPPIHHCRPAVDVLFRSAAEAAGAHAVGVLLTGMGSDGALGMQAIRRAQGRTIAEHESSCVVYGMPRAAVELGAVEAILPLREIPAGIVRAVSGRAWPTPSVG
ncbi:MAG: chemotaxis-specific protein-glutamate methyltransferase CheB [Planctomycetaceae bacterium]